MGRNNYASLLFAEPSLSEGFARVLDVGGSFDDYNYSVSPEEADQIAIAADWYAVGADLYGVISGCASLAGSKASYGRRANAT